MQIKTRYFILIASIVFIAFCTLIYLQLTTSHELKKQINLKYHYRITGPATWYDWGFNRDGTKFLGKYYTCASAYFERYALLEFRNVLNNKTVLVWNNDIHEAGHIVGDLSKKSFKKIAFLKQGKIIVEVNYLGILRKPNPYRFGIERKFKKPVIKKVIDFVQDNLIIKSEKIVSNETNDIKVKIIK